MQLYRRISEVLLLLDISLLPPATDHEQGDPSGFRDSALAPVGALSFVHRIADLVIAWSVFAVIGGGLWLYFRGARRERLWKCGIAVSLLFLASIPVLVVEAKHLGYRTMVAPASVIVLCAYFAFQGYTGRAGRMVSPSRAHAVLGVAAVACVLSAAWHVHTFFTVPQVRELALMRSELAQADLSRIRNIRVVLPAPWQQDTSAPFMWHEFGAMNSTIAGSSRRMHSGRWARFMASFLLRERAPEYAGLPIEIAGSGGFDDPSPQDVLVMDMRKRKFSATGSGRAGPRIGQRGEAAPASRQAVPLRLDKIPTGQ